MAKIKIASGMVLILTFGLMFSSCATYATRGGNVTPIGFFTPTIQANAGRELVGSYFVIAGLFTVGYRDFVRQTDGIEIDIVDRNFLFIFRQIRAVRRHTQQAEQQQPTVIIVPQPVE